MPEIVPAGKPRTRLNPTVVARFRDQVTAEYVRSHPRSRDLHARAKTALPGGDTRTVRVRSLPPV